MERVAVLHPDASARATVAAAVEARGLSVIEVSSCEELAAEAARAPIALVMVAAETLLAEGLDALSTAAIGGRALAHVPLILLAERGDPVFEGTRAAGIDELLWVPIDARELALRIESGL